MVSGAGKGHSTNIMEQEFVSRFKKPFLSKVFPVRAADNIMVLATEKAKSIIANNQSTTKKIQKNQLGSNLIHAFEYGSIHLQ